MNIVLFKFFAYDSQLFKAIGDGGGDEADDSLG